MGDGIPTSTQHFPLLQAQIPFSRFIFTESLKYDWGDVTAVFSRSRRYHSPERAPKIKYFMSKNMKIIPRKDPRLPPSWTLLGEAPKGDKNRGLHFLCKKGGKKLQYFGLSIVRAFGFKMPGLCAAGCRSQSTVARGAQV